MPAKRLAKLRMIAMKLGIRIRPVEKWEYLQPIGAFAGVCDSMESFYDGDGFSDPMLVMAHFSEPLFDAFLQALRASALPSIALKAVLTNTNAAWNSLELHEELCEEHAAMQAGINVHEKS